MVQVRKSYPRCSDGSLDVDAWIDHLNGFSNASDKDRFRYAINAAETAQSLDPDIDEDGIRSNGKIGCFASGLEMASILNELHLDEDAIIAAVIYRAIREKRITLESVTEKLGSSVTTLVEGVLRMAAISELRMDGETVLGQSVAQTEKIRKMLVSMVDDVRVGLIKLAERTQAIRSVKKQSKKNQRKVATEVFEIYAPLAHRLGIGQIKWELEDLSFRYLHPDEYKFIASLLDERRIDRQNYIENIVSVLGASLTQAGIEAEVDGRAKHIYSIWRKMQRKDVSFDQVYDIRAVRVLVREIKDCYACLGIVHTLWKNIPKEFDDYIANPKPNGYRSLHTAVIGAEGKVVEVQIRTREMHEEAELGVCAHWRYKGTDESSAASSYEQKIEWLRTLLEWREEFKETGELDEFMQEMAAGIERDRIYVFTPRGHVIDLAVGATPLDFAYHVHTDVGHRCRGAKVDGRIAPLNSKLESGQKVEIITGSEVAPNHDWLRSSLGYLTSARARSKVRAWFKKQARSENVARGRKMLDREMHRVAIENCDDARLAEQLGYDQIDDMLAALGAGDIPLRRPVSAAEKLFGSPVEVQESLFQAGASDSQRSQGKISVSGVGNLLTAIAFCCKPVPGDDIVGYVTQNRGVTIHRKDCKDFLQSASFQPDRVIQVSWGAEDSDRYSVDIAVEAYDRQGLLSDITSLLSAMRVNVNNINTRTDQLTHIAHMRLTIDISGIEQLFRLLGRLNNLPNVINAARIK